MKHCLAACIAVAALSMISTPAAAQTVRMTATLSGGEETPAPGVATGASGTAAITIDVPNQEMTVTLTVFNLPSPTSAAHIHVSPRGLSGPVVIDFPLPTGRTGDLTISFRAGRSSFRPRPEIGIGTIEDAIQAMLTGNAYVNVHTVANGAGEIRGQLTVSQ